MLNTSSVELTKSVEQDLTWKSVRKGSRSSSRLKKPAMKPEVGQQKDDNKSTKKEPAPVSEPQKPGVSILGRRFADKIELVPIKKRKLLFQSTPTPPQNPPPNVEETQSTQTKSSRPAEDSASGQCSGLDSVESIGPTAVQGTEVQKNPQVAANIKHEVSASGQCSGVDPVSGCNGPTAVQCSGGTQDGKITQVAKIKTEDSIPAQCSGLDSVPHCNGPTSVQFSQGIHEGHLNVEIPRVANVKLEVCSDFEQRGDAACRSTINDTVDAKGSPTMGNLSKPVVTDPSQSGSPLEKVSTSEKTADLIQDASASNDNNDDSKVNSRDDDTLDSKGSPHNSRPVASDSSLPSLILEKAATFYGTSNMVREPSVNNDSINDPNGHALQAGESVKSQEEGGSDDNTLDAKGSLTMDDLSRPVATDSALTTPSLEKAATAGGATNLVQEAVAHDDGIDDSKVHMKCANMSVKCHEEGDTEANKVTARKDDRLKWDLNTIMESWDDDCEEGIPHSDEHIEKVENVGSRVPCEPVVGFPNHSSAGAEASAQAVCMDNLTMGTAHFEIRSGMFLDPVVSEKIAPETKRVQSKDDLRQTFDASDKGISCRESLTMGSYQMLDVESPASKLGKTGSFQASPEHDNLSASGTTFEEGQPVVADVVEGGKETSAPDAAQKDNSMQVRREQIPKSYDFLGEASVEDCDYGYDSDVSQSAHGHVVGIKNRRDNQSGYESPFEDGELRELDALAREENEENEVGFETECVDYDLDDRDADEFDAPNHCMSEIASEICQNDKGSSTEKLVDSSAAPLNESSYLSKDITGDHLPDGTADIGRSIAAGNVALEENVAPDQTDGLIAKSSSVGEVGPRETRERVFRQPEEPLYSGGNHRERNTYLQRSRYRYDPSYNSGKVFGSGRPIRRHQDESQGGRQWVGNLRKLPPTGNEYPLDDEDPRPRNVNSNSVEKADGQTHRFQRRLVHNNNNNNPSNNYRQPFVRRRSPSDRDDTYSSRGGRGGVESRDGSNFRSRGRPGMYRQGVSRNPRDEYGPICDSGPSSVQQQHYTARREQRSFSPVSRDNNFSHPRRRSRSRSRSPPMWHVQRDRSMGVSPPSRSVEFRPDSRMERVRPTFRKSNFAADDEEFMASPPRSRFSPPSNSRWIDDRKCGNPNFRGRKMSGGRFSTRNERFHAEGSPEPPMKSDDSYRSTTRPGRFSEMSGGRGRGRRYDNTGDNRMKYRDRYEFPQRPRHYDTSPVPRRFNCATEDCSENEGERVRDTDGREPPLRSMEERGPPPRFNKERMYG